MVLAIVCALLKNVTSHFYSVSLLPCPLQKKTACSPSSAAGYFFPIVKGGSWPFAFLSAKSASTIGINQSINQSIKQTNNQSEDTHRVRTHAVFLLP